MSLLSVQATNVLQPSAWAAFLGCSACTSGPFNAAHSSQRIRIVFPSFGSCQLGHHALPLALWAGPLPYSPPERAYALSGCLAFGSCQLRHPAPPLNLRVGQGHCNAADLVGRLRTCKRCPLHLKVQLLAAVRFDIMLGHSACPSGKGVAMQLT